jgi:predicted nucleic acid-binding protein
MIVYLDENCLQRGFDDQTQPRIKMEAIACQDVIQRAEAGELDLVWSFMLLDETLRCPFPERKMAILRLSRICKIRVGPGEEIYKLSLKLQNEYSLAAKDAIHLGCASFVNSNVFLTRDYRFIRKIKRLENMEILNPIDYIRKEVM